MRSREGRGTRPCLLFLCALFLFAAGPLSGQEKKRAFEVYSDVRFEESEGDFAGVELELLIWDGSVDGTLSVHGRMDPLKMRGSSQGDEVSLFATQGELVLQLTGTRHKKKFDGTLLLRRKGEILWSQVLTLPRRSLSKT